MARRKLAAAALLAPLAVASTAGAIKLSVRGAASIEARVLLDGDAQVIRGALRDDVGAPIARAHVEIEVISPEGKPVDLPPPSPCGPTAGGHLPHAAPDAYVLDTDGQGAFCVRAPIFASRGALRVRFRESASIAPASIDIPFDAERPAPQLAWDPRPEAIDLDLPISRPSVVATERASGSKALDNLRLVLVDEAGKRLSGARTDERGRATFELPSRELGPPGSGELVVRAEEGAPALSPLRARVVRSARVNLVAAPPSEAVVPHDGYLFEAAAETSRGPAQAGAVEARIGLEIVGVGAVQNGRARVMTTFDVPAEGAVDVTFTFLPSGPELRPGEPLRLRVPVKPPSILRRAPLFALGLLLVMWLGRGWRRPPRAARAARAEAGPGAGPLPAFEPVAEKGASGWRGVVLDAHDQRPIEGATVSVLARDFLGERRVAEALTGPSGQFAIEAAWDPGRILVVESRLHARAERALPKPGRVNVALFLRRRALVERLIAAARRAGGWVAPHGEPTPGQVARGLLEQQRPGAERWARAVESAAFGQEPVDAAAEARVLALETDLPRREPADWVRR